MLFANLSVLILLVVVSTASAYHYNDAGYERSWKDAPRYPDYCCPLEWVNIAQGDELPKDYIVAGYINGTEYAFTRDNNKWTALKSRNKIEEVLTYHNNGVPNPFPVLTNPNKCFFGWYKTKYHKEFPNYNDSNIFYPTTGWTHYGADVRLNGEPGMMNLYGDFMHYNKTAKAAHNTIRTAGIELLYVNCKESLKMMSTSKLIKINLDHNLLKNLTLSDKVVKMRKTYKNQVYRPVGMNFVSGINLINRVDISTIKPFRTSISTNDDTYSKWMAKDVLYSELINEIMLNSRMPLTASKIFHADDATGDSNKILSSKYYDDSLSNEHYIHNLMMIEVPSSSAVTVTAYTQSYKATIPMEVVYEVTPIKAGDNLITQRALELSLLKFGTQKKIEPTDRGTLLVYFDAVLDIDTGNEVSFEVETTPLEKLSVSYGNPIDNGTILN